MLAGGLFIAGLVLGFVLGWIVQDRRFMKMLNEELKDLKENVIGTVDYFVEQ